MTGGLRGGSPRFAQQQQQQQQQQEQRQQQQQQQQQPRQHHHALRGQRQRSPPAADSDFALAKRLQVCWGCPKYGCCPPCHCTTSYCYWCSGVLAFVNTPTCCGSPVLLPPLRLLLRLPPVDQPWHSHADPNPPPGGGGSARSSGSRS